MEWEEKRRGACVSVLNNWEDVEDIYQNENSGRRSKFGKEIKNTSLVIFNLRCL